MRTARITLIGLLIMVGSAPGQTPLPTIDGPESPDLAGAVRGYIVVDRPVGGIVAYELPECRAHVVRPCGAGHAPVHSISGPDRRGRIAFIESSLLEKSHALVTIKLDGSETVEVLRRPGCALWDKVIGEHLALAPVKGRCAFVSGLSRQQMHDPKALLLIGSLEIWDVDRQEHVRTVSDVLDQGVSWFSDGDRLTFVKLMRRDELKEVWDSHDCAAGFGAWREVPVVCSHDVEKDVTTVLHVGRHPLITQDGQGVLVQGWDLSYLRIAADGGEAEPVRWPGNWHGPLAVLDHGHVLYLGLPTTGTPPTFTEHNSPLVGPKPQGTIKLGELNGRRFLTLLPDIDPRRKISYGCSPNN